MFEIAAVLTIRMQAYVDPFFLLASLLTSYLLLLTYLQVKEKKLPV